MADWHVLIVLLCALSAMTAGLDSRQLDDRIGADKEALRLGRDSAALRVLDEAGRVPVELPDDGADWAERIDEESKLRGHHAVLVTESLALHRDELSAQRPSDSGDDDHDAARQAALQSSGGALADMQRRLQLEQTSGAVFASPAEQSRRLGAVCASVQSWLNDTSASDSASRQCLGKLLQRGELPFLLVRIGGSDLANLLAYLDGEPPSYHELSSVGGGKVASVEAWLALMRAYVAAVRDASVYVDMAPLDRRSHVPARLLNRQALRMPWTVLLSQWYNDDADDAPVTLAPAWPELLAGKRVLYVGKPPADSELQELTRSGAVVAVVDASPLAADWSLDAVQAVTDQIDLQPDFDVGVAAAGSFSPLIAHHVFSRNRTAVCLGGSMSQLFAVKQHWQKSLRNYLQEAFIGPT